MFVIQSYSAHNSVLYFTYRTRQHTGLYTYRCAQLYGSSFMEPILNFSFMEFLRSSIEYNHRNVFYYMPW